MKRYTSPSACVMSLLLLLMLALGSVAQNVPAPIPGELQEQYDAAVNDAKNAEPSEIATDLTAIVRCNDRLKWEDQPDGSSHVLVSTWVSDDVAKKFYEGNEGSSIPLKRDVWVTAVPQVQDFCRQLHLAGEGLTLRLEQLLGMPPHNGKAKFVELWVDTRDLFRPCPDPEITDQRCELEFPRTRFLTVSIDYVNWFDNQMCQSYPTKPSDYTGTKLVAYPWTHLGYTYDWGNPTNHVGKSEFIIKTGAMVKVKDVKSTADYCQTPRS